MHLSIYLSILIHSIVAGRFEFGVTVYSIVNIVYLLSATCFQMPFARELK